MTTIKALIGALMSVSAATNEAPAKHCARPCQMSPVGMNLVQHFEGYSPFIYDDGAGYPTIGYGHLIRPGEKFKEPLLPDAATELLKKDMRTAVNGVNRRVAVPLRQTQFDPLVSFTFNVGEGALGSSTLLKRVNAKKHDEVPPQFRRWTKAGGKEMRGLVVRREAEATLYQK